MKKKILFMTLAMAVALTACSSGEIGRNRDGAEVNGTENSDRPSEDEGEGAEGGAESEEGEGTDVSAGSGPDESGEDSEQTKSDEEKSDAGYAKGEVTETGWESAYLGLRYTAPEGMGMATEEYLNDLMNIGQEALSGDYTDLQLKYAELTTVYEMMSLDTMGSATNVLVSVEKLPLSSMDTEMYMSSLRQQLEQLTAINYTVLSDGENVQIGGEDFVLLSCQGESQAASVIQNYYVRVMDNRAVAIIVTYTEDTADMVETILNAFEAY